VPDNSAVHRSVWTSISSVWKIHHVTHVAPRILRWLPDFLKISGLLTQNIGKMVEILKFQILLIAFDYMYCIMALRF
jgi:hypothetical protein